MWHTTGKCIPTSVYWDNYVNASKGCFAFVNSAIALMAGMNINSECKNCAMLF